MEDAVNLRLAHEPGVPLLDERERLVVVQVQAHDEPERAVVRAEVRVAQHPVGMLLEDRRFLVQPAIHPQLALDAVLMTFADEILQTGHPAEFLRDYVVPHREVRVMLLGILGVQTLQQRPVEILLEAHPFHGWHNRIGQVVVPALRVLWANVVAEHVVALPIQPRVMFRARVIFPDAVLFLIATEYEIPASRPPIAELVVGVLPGGMKHDKLRRHRDAIRQRERVQIAMMNDRLTGLLEHRAFDVFQPVVEHQQRSRRCVEPIETLHAGEPRRETVGEKIVLIAPVRDALVGDPRVEGTVPRATVFRLAALALRHDDVAGRAPADFPRRPVEKLVRLATPQSQPVLVREAGIGQPFDREARRLENDFKLTLPAPDRAGRHAFVVIVNLAAAIEPRFAERIEVQNGAAGRLTDAAQCEPAELMSFRRLDERPQRHVARADRHAADGNLAEAEKLVAAQQQFDLGVTTDAKGFGVRVLHGWMFHARPFGVPTLVGICAAARAISRLKLVHQTRLAGFTARSWMG